jgi:dipeptide transport system substrate-binding protein
MSDVRVRKRSTSPSTRKPTLNALFGKGNAWSAPTRTTDPAGLQPQAEEPAHDLDKARALLKEAGVPEGTVFTLFTRNGGGPTNPNPMLGAQMMQADLAKVGIKVDIRVMEWGEMLKRAKAASTIWCRPAGPAITATRTTSSRRCSAAKRQKRRKLRPLVQQRFQD